MIIFPRDVLDFLGRPQEAEVDDALVRHLDTATAMVRAYTRGRGFDDDFGPGDDLAAVIVSCAARLHSNPAGDRQITSGPFAVSPGTFQGWTLAELAVLNGYRKRAW